MLLYKGAGHHGTGVTEAGQGGSRAHHTLILQPWVTAYGMVPLTFKVYVLISFVNSVWKPHKCPQIFIPSMVLDSAKEPVSINHRI